MKTIFTVNDMKNIIEGMFNGYVQPPEIPSDPPPAEPERKNENTEHINLINENNEVTNIDIEKYLNVKFYTWKERLDERTSSGYTANSNTSLFEPWVESLNLSMDESYALVTIDDTDAVTSQDIDSTTIVGTITFMVQSQKTKTLDYYINKLRNKYIGLPQTIRNQYGDDLTSYFLWGICSYSEEPTPTQFGEMIKVSVGYKLTYLNAAQTYSDVKIEMSLDKGNTFYTIPLTQQSWQAIITSSAANMATRPDLTGFLGTALTTVVSFSFFDFNKAFNNELNKLFWGLGAFQIGNNRAPNNDVNILIYVKATVTFKDERGSTSTSYLYQMMLDNIKKSITNNSFNITTMTLKLCALRPTT